MMLTLNKFDVLTKNKASVEAKYALRKGGGAWFLECLMPIHPKHKRGDNSMQLQIKFKSIDFRVANSCL